jgi:hypothetical protein
MMAINEEDGTIEAMAKILSLNKSETCVLAFNLLCYVLDQRKAGMHLTFAKGEDKTKDILTEACAGNVLFTLN